MTGEEMELLDEAREIILKLIDNKLLFISCNDRIAIAEHCSIDFTTDPPSIDIIV